MSRSDPSIPRQQRGSAAGPSLVRWAGLLDLALVAAATALLAGQLARAPRWTVDDAWIVVRYAEHWVRHGELAFNLGEAPVEGFTSPVMLAVASLAVLFGGDPMSAMIVLGTASVPVALAALVALARAIGAPPGAAGVVALSFACAPAHVEHATSGLETEVFVAATLVVFATLARALRRSDVELSGVAVAGSFCALVRPEGIVVALGAASIGAVAAARGGRSLRSIASTLGGLLVGPLLTLLVARRTYFGGWLPNTYYAKIAANNAVFLLDAGRLVRASLLPVALCAVAAIALRRVVADRSDALPTRAGESSGASRARVAIVGLALGVFVAELAVYSRSDLLMNFGKRFAMHALPSAAACALVLVASSLEALAQLRQSARDVARSLQLIGCAALLATWPRQADERVSSFERMSSYDDTMRTRYVPLAELLRDSFSPTAVLAVYPDAGIVPYVSRMKTVDFGRLNDAELARGPRDPRFVVDTFFRRAPDALLISIEADGQAWEPLGQAILDAPEFASSYRLVRDIGRPGRPHVRLYFREVR
jgi:arabinofuranosyltransferase